MVPQMSEKTLIFCDASVSNQEKIAIGAFFTIEEKNLKNLSSLDPYALKEFVSSKIKYVEVNTHKSTLAEIKTFLHIIKSLQPLSEKELTFYTDCQTLTDLHGFRGKKLISREFKKKDGSPLKHEKIYREIINLFQTYKIDIIKIKGHSPSSKKNNIIDLVFSIIDKHSRKKLRSIITKDDNKIIG